LSNSKYRRGKDLEQDMKKEANSMWDVIGAAFLAMAIPIFIAVGLGLAALFGEF
jgi:hypothetical protein